MDSVTAEILWSIFKILLALLLVFLNGLFVAAEFAFVKVRPTRIAQLIEEGNPRAASVRNCIDNLDAYLSVSQLGITLSSLGLGWLGEPAIAALISPLLFRWGWSSPTLVHSISFVTAFALITFLHVVFGELAPKSLAIQKAETLSLYLAAPMRFFYRLFYPAVVLLNGTARKIIILFGIKPGSDEERTHSEEELRMIISESFRGGQINESEQELLQNVFRFEERLAEEIMVPRTEAIFLNTEDTLEENLTLARQTRHTRYPLCEGDFDHIIGLIHIKDLLYIDGEVHSLNDIMRDIMFVPETMPIDRLLTEFQRHHQHMAVVLDEYGGTSGLVTMDNILEVLVGEIQDEFDEEEPEVRQEENGNYLVNGRIHIDDAAEYFGLKVEEDEPYNTLAGFIINRLGKQPREGDVIVQDDIKLEVVKMTGRRIDRVRLYAGKTGKTTIDNRQDTGDGVTSNRPR